MSSEANDNDVEIVKAPKLPPPVPRGGPKEPVSREHVRVVARFRPVLKLEIDLDEKKGGVQDEVQLLIDEKRGVVGLDVAVANRKGVISGDKRGEKHQFILDRVFGPESTQYHVYEEIAKDTVKWVTLGYHGTIFACK
jgi:Kinesin motor domain